MSQTRMRLERNIEWTIHMTWDLPWRGVRSYGNRVHTKFSVNHLDDRKARWGTRQDRPHTKLHVNNKYGEVEKESEGVNLCHRVNQWMDAGWESRAVVYLLEMISSTSLTGSARSCGQCGDVLSRPCDMILSWIQCVCPVKGMNTECFSVYTVRLVVDWLMVGFMVDLYGWFLVGFWLAYGWLMVGFGINSQSAKDSFFGG